MAEEIVIGVRLILINCDTCGIQFGLPKEWDAARRQDHKTWYCPNGHQWSYVAESDVSRITREKEAAINRAQAQVNEARHARLVAEKERDNAIRAKRRVERRISKGVCPCCNRTFEDLARHMHTKHKGYALPAGAGSKQITGTVQ